MQDLGLCAHCPAPALDRDQLWNMVCGEEAEHKEEENGMSGKCTLYVEELGYSFNDLVCVTGAIFICGKDACVNLSLPANKSNMGVPVRVCCMCTMGLKSVSFWLLLVVIVVCQEGI